MLLGHLKVRHQAPTAGLDDFKHDSEGNFPLNVFSDCETRPARLLDATTPHREAPVRWGRHEATTHCIVPSVRFIEATPTRTPTAMGGVQSEVLERCRVLNNVACQLNQALRRAEADDRHTL